MICFSGLKKNELLVFLFFLVNIIGCTTPDPRFGPMRNVQRRERGLEELPVGWRGSMGPGNYCNWLNPALDRLLKEGHAFLGVVTVSFDEERQVTAENDVYYSGKEFATVGGHSDESLSVKFYYKPQRIADTVMRGWVCVYEGPFAMSGVGRSISLGSADSMLNTWGLKPPLRKQ